LYDASTRSELQGVHRVDKTEAAPSRPPPPPPADSGGQAIPALVAALAAAQRAGDLARQGWLLAHLGALATAAGDRAAARRRLSKALSVYERLGDDAGQVSALNSLGALCCLERRYASALVHLERALRLARVPGSASGSGGDGGGGRDTRSPEARARRMVLAHTGLAYRGIGRYREALACCREALALVPPDDWQERFGLQASLGSLYRRMGSYRRAAEHLVGAARAPASGGLGLSLVVPEAELASILLDEGRGREARRMLSQARARASSPAAPHRVNPSLLYPMIALPASTGDLEGAMHVLSGRLEDTLVAEELEGLAPFYSCLADLYLGRGNLDAAESCVHRGLAEARRHRDLFDQALLLRKAGNVAERRGDLAAARRLLQRALSLHQRIGDRRGVAGDALHLARVLERAGQREPARAARELCLSMARDEFPRLVAQACLDAALDARRADRLDPALASCRRGLDAIRGRELPVEAAALARLLEDLATRSGQPDLAARAHRESQRALRRLTPAARARVDRQVAAG
jgi:tetratricopeptide (TPR) repeat protein